MPKLYLLDNGYRNALLNLFAQYTAQIPDGYALENILFGELIRRGQNDIRFWRTQTQHEVDFVLGETQAFEVKCSEAGYKPSKYKLFQATYPEIPLQLVTQTGHTALNALDFTS